MSSRQFESFFGSMSWSGGGWRRGNFSDGYSASPLRYPCGPADVLTYLVDGDLRSNDGPHKALVGAEIHRFGFRPQVYKGNLPALWIYSGTVSQDEKPGGLDEHSIDIFIELVFGMTAIAPAASGAATIASALHYIEWFMKQREEMVVQVDHPTEPSQKLAVLGLVQPHQTGGLLDDGGRQWAYSQGLHIRYLVETDRATGRIYNLARTSS